MKTPKLNDKYQAFGNDSRYFIITGGRGSGSEEEFWVMVAENAKNSQFDRKMIAEYVYGKPGENLDITKGAENVDISIMIVTGKHNPKLFFRSINILYSLCSQ